MNRATAARNAARADAARERDLIFGDIVAEHDCTPAAAGRHLGMTKTAAFDAWKRICARVGVQAV